MWYSNTHVCSLVCAETDLFLHISTCFRAVASSAPRALLPPLLPGAHSTSPPAVAVAAPSPPASSARAPSVDPRSATAPVPRSLLRPRRGLPGERVTAARHGRENMHHFVSTP